MNFRKEFFSRHSITTFLVLILFIISPSKIISQDTTKCDGCTIITKFWEEAGRITYTVECDTPFTDFHLRFVTQYDKRKDPFYVPSYPIGWVGVVTYPIKGYANVSWVAPENKKTKKGDFVVGLKEKPVTTANNTDWEITNDNGTGTAFDDNFSGVIARRGSDPDLPHLVMAKPESECNGPCLSIGLKGGWHGWALDDFDIPKTGCDVEDFDGSFQYGCDISGEYCFTDSHILGLKTGYSFFPGNTYKQNCGMLNTSMELSAYAIPIGLYYKFPVHDDIFVELGGGLDYYNSKIDYDVSTSEYPALYRGELNDSGLGYHFNLGAELFISSDLAITLDAGYSSAKLDDFKGSLVNEEGVETEMLLTMVPNDLGRTLSHIPVSESLPEGYRPAEINFNGLDISIGIKYILFGCRSKRLWRGGHVRAN